jgi:hypothetical protein
MKPSYCRNLRQGIESLRRSPSPWLGRKDLEDALNVSKTVAWRLMRQCGAVPGPGNMLLCSRERLLEALEELRNGDGRVQWELRRRQRLELLLEQARPEALARRTPVASGAGAAAIQRAELASLPRNVRLGPGTLEISFRDMPELLAALGAVVYALNNDFDAVSRITTTVGETPTEGD